MLRSPFFLAKGKEESFASAHRAYKRWRKNANASESAGTASFNAAMDTTAMQLARPIAAQRCWSYHRPPPASAKTRRVSHGGSKRDRAHPPTARSNSE